MNRWVWIGAAGVIVACALILGAWTDPQFTAPPSATSEAVLREGATVLGESGCLACHRIGSQGNDGPGPTLTTVGAHLAQSAINHAIDDPREPMPSYRALPPIEHFALVAYLVSLKAPRDVIPVPADLAPPTPIAIPKRTLCSEPFYRLLARVDPSHKRQLAKELRHLCGPGWNA
jgi:mono/diheme cytochrome c family protein